jgi:hypothetical protein
VDVVGAGEAVDLVPGLELEPQGRAAGEESPAVAVAVDRQRRVAAEPCNARRPDPVEVYHHAGPAFLHDEIVPSEHLVGLPRDVEGEHRLPAASFCMTEDHRHHGPDTVCERALGRVGHELVVLDEADASVDELLDERRDLSRRQPDARLDYRADQRPAYQAALITTHGSPPCTPTDLVIKATVENRRMGSDQCRLVLGFDLFE